MTQLNQNLEEAQQARTLPDSELVAWCPADKWWAEARFIGTLCVSSDCERKFIKRRGWVCRERSYCYEVFFTKEAFYVHTCGDAY